MASDFMDMATVSAAIGALISIIGTLISWFYANRNRQLKVKISEAADFKKILDSSTLSDLGKYLDESIGQFDVSEYATSDDVSSRIDRYIAKLKDYVGTGEEITEEDGITVPETVEHAPESPVELSHAFHPPFDKVYDELANGERWNALARLRRHVEIRLREIAHSLGYDERQLRSAGQMAHLLATNDRLNQNAVAQLRYTISVCNRAIHGSDVSEDESMEALWVAQNAMENLMPSEAHGVPNRE